MRQYRVEKIRAQVTMRMKSGAQIAGRLFLPSEPDGEPTINKVRELLNGYDSFLPLEVEGGHVVLQNKDLLSWCRFDGPVGPVLEVITPRRRMTLLLIDGTSLSGDVVATGPPDARRVLDCLNQAEPFLLLETREADYIVRKDVIACVPSGELGDSRDAEDETQDAFEVEEREMVVV